MLSDSAEAITWAYCQVIDGKTCNNALIVQEKPEMWMVLKECFSVISGSLSLEAVVWENKCIGLAQEYAKAPD